MLGSGEKRRRRLPVKLTTLATEYCKGDQEREDSQDPKRDLLPMHYTLKIESFSLLLKTDVG
ncbi:hypothetical protein NC651_031067 [Populus alba x Populus x berolinensis]|nr:hypothetical protein NC651_031067 [Populus alba x Populus x berolinensis]